VARIRTVKPEYFTSTQVAECSPLARLLFIGMWCFCDDGGVHPADPMRLKMEVFPADPFTKDQMAEWIGELLSQGLLVEFDSDGKRFWSVTGWHHQKIEKKTIKHPQRVVAEESASSRRVVGDESSNTSREVAESSPPEGKGRDTDTEGNGKGMEHPLNPPKGDGERDLVEMESSSEEKSSSEDEPMPSETMREIVSEWNKIPGVTKADRITAKRRASLNARLREAYFRSNWQQGIARVALSDFCRGAKKWRADIDWFLRPDTLVKILEGAYDNARGSPGGWQVQAPDQLANGGGSGVQQMTMEEWENGANDGESSASGSTDCDGGSKLPEDP
jgi:hypothetical protein